MKRIEIEGATAFECADDDTILRAALRAGIGMPYSCNVGACGNCRFELKAGAVEHERTDAPAWTERDRKRGRWLGCQARPLEDCQIKLRLDPEAMPLHQPVRMTARLTDVVEITHDLWEFGFALDGPDGFLPGQYALITPEGFDCVRAYSMCNLPGEGAWRFQIKRVGGGLVTAALFERLKPGDTVRIDGPYGNAYLREDAPRDLLLIAGGSGLSPMISIARAAAASRALAEREIHFVYGGRAPRDVCGEAILAELPGFGGRIHYRAAISEPAEGWTGPTGFVHDVTRAIYGDRLGAFEIYFAGPPLMAQAVQTMLNEAGVPPERIHFDEFY